MRRSLLPSGADALSAGPGCWSQAATPAKGLALRMCRRFPVGVAGSLKFPQNPLSLCTCSYDSGRTGTGLAFTSRRHGPGAGNALGFFDDTFEAQSHGLATRCLRFAVAVTRPDARLACGCWLSSAARDSDPLSSKERFRLCVDHISSSSSRELAWRNPRLFFGRMACSPAVALASCGKPTDC